MLRPVSLSTSRSQMWAPNAGPAAATLSAARPTIGPPVALALAATSVSVSGERSPAPFSGTSAAAFPADVRHVGVPDFGGAGAQLFAHVAGRLDHRHAGRVAHAAAAGDVGVPGRVRIGDRRTDALHRDAELLGNHQRLRDTRAADVGVAGEHRGAAVAVERDRRARVHAGVEPEAAGHAASLVRSRSAPVQCG